MRLHYYKYTLNKGVQRIKTKIGTIVTATILAVSGGFGLSLALSGGSVFADNNSSNFDSPSYQLGSINGQHGWSALGSTGSSLTAFDEKVVTNNYGYTAFGNQSFRISNAVTNSGFSDQTFSPMLSQPAGEADALNLSGNTVASPNSHFEAQFDIASTTKNNQGMSLSISPDRGDGARMSYLRFQDQADGIHAYFDDVTDPSHTTDNANFIESDVATLSYSTPHTINFVMNFYNGPDNDVVYIFIDGKLVKTGTSWEDYYRYDTESNPGLSQNDSRTVSTLLFRESGTAVPSNLDNGYLIDNLTTSSSNLNTSVPPTAKDQCMNSGWMSYGSAFKNQGDCVSFVASKGKNQPTGSFSQSQSPARSATGTVTLSNPTQTLTLNAFDNGLSKNDSGYISYDNPGVVSYTVPPTCVNVSGNTAYVAYQIPSSASVSANVWVVWKVVDNGSSNDTAGFTTAPDEATANALCQNGNPIVTNYAVTAGDITVKS